MYFVYGRKLNGIEMWTSDYEAALEDFLTYEPYHEISELPTDVVLENMVTSHKHNKNGQNFIEFFPDGDEDRYISISSDGYFSFEGIATEVVSTDFAFFDTFEKARDYVVYKNPNGTVLESGFMYASVENGNWEYSVSKQEIR